MAAIGLLDMSLVIQVKVFSRAKMNLGQLQENLAVVIDKLESENRGKELVLKADCDQTKGQTYSINRPNSRPNMDAQIKLIKAFCLYSNSRVNATL